MPTETATCSITQKDFLNEDLVLLSTIRPKVARLISKTFPTLVMQLRSIVVIIAFAVTAHAADPLPTGWKPDLGNTTQYLDYELEQGPGQQQMNRVTGALAEISDARVAIAYLQLYAVLPTKEQSALKTEQTKWLKSRNRHALRSVESEGGSLAPTEHSLAYAEFTKARIAALEKRLAAVLKTRPKQP
jgi:uncharacterized protein YecT (DUF1311 family)